jgi:uncharacterized protein YceK
MKSYRFPVYLCLLFSVAGCASIGTRQREGAGRPYAGVREDIYYLAHPEEADKPALQSLNVIDLPFSFLLDTLLLPYDLSRQTKHAEPSDPPNDGPATSVENLDTSGGGRHR